MRLVLVDDETNVRENLKSLLKLYVPDAEVVGEAEGVITGIDCIEEHKPDVVLLDVEMKDGSGFDLLSNYGELDFKLIFVTAHDGYAIRAFKYSAMDYVLKPIDPDDLIASLKKAEALIDQSEENLKVSTFFQNQQSPGNEQKIVLKDAESVYLISIKDIVRCESDTNYTRFYISDGRELLISKTLKEYDALFKGKFFFRAHQSHLINLHHFDRYDKKEGGIVYMKDGSVLPVAVRKKEALMSALQKL
jgi:two-component system LytT family response regulator